MKEILKMAPERCAKLKDFSEVQWVRPLQRQSVLYDILDKVYTVRYKRREVVTRYQTRLLDVC